MNTLLWIIGLTGGWVALAVLMNYPRERRLRKLAAARAGSDSFVQFRRSFPDVPEDVLRRVYTAVQGIIAHRNFPLRADDDLWTMLEVDQGSVDMMLEEILDTKAHGTIPALMASSPLRTVGDVVRSVWLQEQQRTGNAP